MNKREKTRPIFVKGIQIGGNNQVIIQSMTTTKTHDTDATITQIKELHEMGCQIIRVAVLGYADANNLVNIVKLSPIPVVADIHYNFHFALDAIKAGIHKLRINPGNIANEKQIEEIVEAAKKAKIPIRIGVNSGSLPKDLVKEYGVTPKSMILAAERHIKILESHNFFDIALSLKSSDPLMAIDCYRQASLKWNYPLHLGITEAGSIFSGAIKSAAGLGVLLEEGIGSTIRISLSGDPIHEIKACKTLLNSFKLAKNIPNLIACPTCGRIEFDMLPIMNSIEKYLEKIKVNINVAILGCPVNGIGEAAHADVGIAGGRKGGLLFKDGKVIKTLPQEKLLDALKEQIDIVVKEKEALKN